jgi:hypothetical protein
MPELTRRTLAAGAAVAATLPARAVPASAGTHPSPSVPASSGHDHGGPQAFDEVYLGRWIQGRPAAGGHHHGSGYGVFIDGVELHVMRNADGGWISVVSHYDPVPSPRAAARAAVVELQGAPLLPFN